MATRVEAARAHAVHKSGKLVVEMFSRGALAFLAVVVAEYLAFGVAAGFVGAMTVVWASVAAAAVGVLLVRHHARNLAQRRPDQGLQILAGILLIVPGLLTGLVGLSLLVPPVRAVVRVRARNRAEAFLGRQFGVPDGLSTMFTTGGPFARRFDGNDDIVDVEWHDAPTGGDPADDDDRQQSAPPELH